jgi:uncharacterized membrane protein
MKRYSSARLTRFLFSITALLLLTASSAMARSITVTRWVDTIHVDDDGSARVSEQITYTFSGSYHGIYRDIPVEYPGPRGTGTNYTLFVKVDRITDALGTPLKYERKVSNGYLKLKVTVPGAVDSDKMVNIEYTVANAVKFFEDHDEFYWNVTGNDSPLPIQYAAADAFFPTSTAGSLRAQAFSGVYGSTQQAKASVQGAAASFETNGPLPMHGGLTIDVYIPKGLLHEPGALTKLSWFVRSNPIVSLPIWAFAVMFSLWWLKGRDPNPGMSVAPMYGPPENMRPAEVGALIDDSVNPRDITSIMVDLAVRGYLKITEIQHKSLLFSSKDYQLDLLKDRDAWGDVSDYERAMLDQIFAGGKVTLLSDLKNHFYTVLPTIKGEVLSALKSQGMYTVDPESAGGLWVIGAILIIAPFAFVQWMGITDFTDSIGPTVICALVALVILVLFGRQLTATSLKGAKTRVQILGFQEFMNRVDSDRLKRMPPDTFEKFLPFAMALGVEHRWAKAFEGIIQNPPTWYSGNWTTFNTLYFVNSLGSMSQQATSAFVSAPRASSSSSGFGSGGSGGGGFSGGGFGGGGTGGW